MPTPTVRRARRGFSLVELMIVVVLLSIVLGTLMAVILRQQRFYRGSAQIMDTRGQLRQATAILPAELRGVSPIDGDIYDASATSIDFRQTYGSSVVCTIDLTRTVIGVPPAGALASGQTFSSWLNVPEVGDQAFVYDTTTRAWVGGIIAAVNASQATGGATGCPNATGFTAAADPATTVSFTSATALSLGVVPGSPVRFTRHVRYSLYQASDGLHYLGYEACQITAGACSPVGSRQPVAGPYTAPNSPLGAGLSFQYFDVSGNAVANTAAGRATIASIRITARGQTTSNLAAPELGTTGQFADSTVVTVALRNR